MMSYRCASCGKEYTVLPADGYCSCGAEMTEANRVEISSQSASIVDDSLPEEIVEAESSGTEASTAPTNEQQQQGGEAQVLETVASPSPEEKPQIASRVTLTLMSDGAPTSTVLVLKGEKVTIGKFDPSTGPVDIDLSAYAGSEYISRHHAEIWKEGNVWKIRDLGSTNGIFLKKQGQASFSPRLTEPAELQGGDQVAIGNMAFLVTIE